MSTAATPKEAVEERRSRVVARLARVATPPRELLVATIALYIGVFGSWSLRNHGALATYGFDLGIWDQGLWLLSRGYEPFVTVLGLHLFGDHTTFFLYLLVPLYWVWPSAQALLLAQTVALALGAVPVFLIARRLLRSEWAALLLALVYLLQPTLGWTNLEQFHPDSFEVPLLLFAVYFMLTRRWIAFVVAVLLTLTIKEDVALLTVPFGLYVALRHNRRVGLLVAGVSAVWFAAAVWWILPHFNQIGSLDTFRVPFGGPRGLVEASFTRPWDVVAFALSPERRLYLMQLLVPLGLLPLLSPLSLVALGPVLSNILSTFHYQHEIQYHYATLIVPIAVPALIMALARVPRGRARTGLLCALLVSSLLAAYVWGPGPLAREPAYRGDPSNPLARAAAAAVALVPPNASVAAHNSLVPHLTHRREIYEFPTPWQARYWADGSKEGTRLPQADDVEYVLAVPERMSAGDLAVLASLEDEGFRQVRDTGGVVILVRDP